MLAKTVETVTPARLGRGFRWLLSSAVVNNLGDGIGFAAGPLLVASQTHNPLLVSMAVLLQRLPFLLFGFFAGAVADRVDRRRIVVVVDLLRAVVLVVLAGTIVAGWVSIWVVLATMFLLGTAETFADTASQSLLPGVVPRVDLGIANARLQGAFITTNQLVGPPIGAFLFVAGMAWPFGVNALCFTLGAALISRIVVTRDGDTPRAGPSSMRGDIAEGMRWLWSHPPMRTLALTIVAFNVTFGAAWSVLVLYAEERLGMNEVGFGLLATAGAVGGLIGTGSYSWLERRFSLADILRVGLVIETLTHLALALTRSATVGLLVMVVFGAHAFVWGTTSTTVRQRAVPDQLLGRVTSVYMVGVVGGMVVGAPVGGLLASQWGITAPFWFGFAGSAVLVVLMWREFGHVVHSTEEPVGPRPGD
ncbi:MAG: MFS transporter [Mycobacteriales bacterium]